MAESKLTVKIVVDISEFTAKLQETVHMMREFAEARERARVFARQWESEAVRGRPK